ncbi:MAG TPA: hypothetical protein VN720_05280 [Rudaea sp.]|nr:hypothetical protein [Rudaea sp.]
MNAPGILPVLFAPPALAACAAASAGHLSGPAHIIDRSTPAPQRREVFAAWSGSRARTRR